MSAFHLKMCPLSVFLLDFDDREKLKRKKRRKKKRVEEKAEEGAWEVLCFLFTSQSHSLHLGNSPACLGAVGQKEGRERKGRRGAWELLPEAVLQKAVKKPLLFTSG